jgi:hypothetical protein
MFDFGISVISDSNAIWISTKILPGTLKSQQYTKRTRKDKGSFKEILNNSGVWAVYFNEGSRLPWK